MSFAIIIVPSLRKLSISSVVKNTFKNICVRTDAFKGTNLD